MNLATQMTTPVSITGTERKDAWWISPLAFALLFGAFGAWATFRAFQNNYYHVGNYLSPFYSPTIQTGWKLGKFAISPALIILPFPLSFRLTCYYYRKMIYRSYLLNPVACTVSKPGPPWLIRGKNYFGEKVFPFVLMNFHRYAFYAAAIFVALLWYDTIEAFLFKTNTGLRPGIGLGSLIFLANVILLSFYTFSCHSFRHLIGGGTDCYSCSALEKTKYGVWRKVSFLNEKHGLWAMMSLISVALTDVYVYLIATNTITDLRIL